MLIKSAEFVMSNTDPGLCPETDRPEFAFIGRSNDGKSSLINMLMGKKDLAKTSSEPGKTRLINHFIVNDDWFLVDLPGSRVCQGFAFEPRKMDQIHPQIYPGTRKSLLRDGPARYSCGAATK